MGPARPRDAGTAPAGEMVIRWCGPGDDQAVLEVTHRAFEGTRRFGGGAHDRLEAVAAELAESPGVVAWLGDRPIAAARTKRRPHRLVVRRLAVDPEFRRAGVARLVLAWIAEQARAQGLRGLRASVRTANGPSHSLFVSMGWRVLAQHEEWTDYVLDFDAA